MNLKIIFLPITPIGLFKTRDDKLVGSMSSFDLKLLMELIGLYTEIYFRVDFTKEIYKISTGFANQEMIWSLKDKKGEEYSLISFVKITSVLKVGEQFPVSKKGGSTTFNHKILEILVVTKQELDPSDAENLFEAPLITEFNQKEEER